MHGRERSKACSPLRSSSPRMLAGRRQCNPAQKVTSEVADHVDSAGSPGPRSFCMCIGALGDSSHDTSCHLHYLAVGTLHTSPALQGLVLVSLALAQGLLPLSLYQGLLHRNRGLGVCHEVVVCTYSPRSPALTVAFFECASVWNDTELGV